MISGAAVISSNALSCNTFDGYGSVYKAPELGSANHYVQYMVPSAAITQTFDTAHICVRLEDNLNFIGLHTGNSSGGNGKIEVVHRIEGSWTVDSETAADTVAAGDTLRFEARGTFWTVRKNGAYITSGTIPSELTDTRTGIIMHGSPGPVMDDFSTGTITGNFENFNRSNADLEIFQPLPLAAGHGHIDGAISGALSIVSNQIRCNTSSSTGSAYKSPDPGSLSQFVEFRVANVGHTTGPFICCRFADSNNFIGVRVGSASHGGGEVEVFRRNSGSFTLLRVAASGAEAAVNDFIRLEVEGNGSSGDAWRVYRNGTLDYSGTIGEAMTSNHQGLLARTNASFDPWIDDYEAGALVSSDVITGPAPLSIALGSVTVEAEAAAITQTGSILQWSVTDTANTGTVSSTITVPSDAQIIVVGVSAQQGTNSGLAGMTFTKGGVDTAMTKVAADGTNATWQGAIFWLVLPDTGTNKTLKWDWISSGTSSVDRMNFSATFWTGIDTTSPVRSSGGGQQASALANLTCVTTDKVVAFMAMRCPAANGSGSIDGWNNLSTLANITHNAQAEGVLGDRRSDRQHHLPRHCIDRHRPSRFRRHHDGAWRGYLGRYRRDGQPDHGAVGCAVCRHQRSGGFRLDQLRHPHQHHPDATGRRWRPSGGGAVHQADRHRNAAHGHATGRLDGIVVDCLGIGRGDHRQPVRLVEIPRGRRQQLYVYAYLGADLPLDRRHGAGFRRHRCPVAQQRLVRCQPDRHGHRHCAYPNEELLFIGHDWASSATRSPPSGFTELLDGQPLYIASKDLTALGDTGSASVTSGSSGNPWQAKLIAFVPAGVTVEAERNASVNVTMTALAISAGSVGNPVSVNVSMAALAASTSTPEVRIPLSVTAATNLLTMTAGTASVVGKSSTTTTGQQLTISVGDVTVTLTGGMTVFVDPLPALVIEAGQAAPPRRRWLPSAATSWSLRSAMWSAASIAKPSLPPCQRWSPPGAARSSPGKPSSMRPAKR